jgi:cytochrome c553
MRTLPPALLLAALISASPAAGSEPAAEQQEFFEKRVRPVLAEHCYKCHSAQAKRPKGGLRVDSRAALLEGGDTGPAVAPGHPEKSKLIEAINYKNVDLQMPPRAKLSDAAIADLTEWVKMGAPWPAETKAAKAGGKYDFDLARRKREHWAWQPLRPVTPPPTNDADWPKAALDRFILARLEAQGLRPAAPADRRVLLRRVYFDLIGLPPVPDDVEAFVNDASPQAFAKVVDRLLASPRFGERWGRHWLDLVRYAETRGHEFDYPNPNAHHYRDYVIRALNADVPYDQFVREHLAGDVLPAPRLNPTGRFNESILGTGFWFLGEQLHSPVDICQDKADRFDNMIDVMSKAFLGLTVACARCHDHKFDAISTKDYYALCGFLESSSYRQVPFDTLEHNRGVARRLAKFRADHQQDVLNAWVETYMGGGRRQVPALARCPQRPDLKGVRVIVDYAAPGQALLQDGFAFRLVRPGDLEFGSRATAPIRHVHERAAAVYDPAWDGLKAAPGTQGEPGALAGVMRPGRMLRTPSFVVEPGKVCLLVRGAGKLYAAVEAHAMIAGPLHGKLVRDIKTSGNGYEWVEYDLGAYAGRRAHLEFTPAPGSDLAIALVVQGARPPALVDESVAQFDDASEFLAALGDDRRAPAAARFANELLRRADEPAPAALEKLVATAAPVLAERARLVGEICLESRLAPAMLDGDGVNERVFIRGSYKTAGEVAPRRLLEALVGPDGTKVARGSGRLELARQMTDPAVAPQVPRVVVNRVWHHLFGRGLVASVDNFGVLGEAPSHPELLDFLADEFVRDGWSVKRLIRSIVLSRAYQMASHADADPDRADPENRLLHRMNLRRLEGEAIRDALLAVSGRLDATMFGPPVPVYLTPFQDGRGRPGSGPLDGDGRRSVYLAVRRNFLSPLLLAFDTPTPFSTVGRRTVSNVPAQALILLNDPFVQQQAQVWAKRELSESRPPAERIREMYLKAFARPPAPDELRACADFIDRQTRTSDEPAAWAALAHVLFNTKEFIFVQ